MMTRESGQRKGLWGAEMKLYYHKTDGGAEYLTDMFILCPNGHKEGAFEGAKYIVRIDGDITKDAELIVRETGGGQ